MKPIALACPDRQTGSASPPGGRRRRGVAARVARTFAAGLVLTGCVRSAASPISSPSTTSTTSTTSTPSTSAPRPPAPSTYPVHTGISATTFWVGEPADNDSGHISNAESAWDDRWIEHFGGIDDPRHRNGWRPAGFVPRENPFYVALPYNDLDENGQAKGSAAAVPWAGQRASADQSVLKNRWVRIDYHGKSVYAQWEDAGPMGEDDFAYVFGGAAPKNRANERAGIDLSPAAQDYLGLDGLTPVTWQFVDQPNVPPGPWLVTVTTSGVDH